MKKIVVVHHNDSPTFSTGLANSISTPSLWIAIAIVAAKFALDARTSNSGARKEFGEALSSVTKKENWNLRFLVGQFKAAMKKEKVEISIKEEEVQQVQAIADTTETSNNSGEAKDEPKNEPKSEFEAKDKSKALRQFKGL